MAEEKNTLVYLTEEDATRFKQFCQYYEKFSFLLERDIFDIKNGRAILHFDCDGVLRQINVERISYKSYPQA
jgi:hypothetical protein